MDLFSRYTEVDFIYDICSETICDAFEKTWLKKYEHPAICLTDNGRQFTSINFENLLKTYNVKHITSAPYNPTGNGLVERANREIGTVLRLLRGKTLGELRKGIWRRLNCTANIQLGNAPYEIYFEKPIFKNHDMEINIARDEIKRINERRVRKYENEIKSKDLLVKFKIGDKVFTKTHSPDKIESKWKGPYTIVAISSSGNNLNIDMGNKIVRVSVKNCRPMRRGEDVVCMCDTTKESKSRSDGLEPVKL
ncbi:Pol polyprotein [Dictyocoela muelleri]|nr:Pol polyprotein [Dictyocoela muelleri]